jgi:Photosynthetic reaction centre cytochrome C subunit
MTRPYKKMIVLSGLAVFILLGILAARPPEEEKPVYKNLKVLSKKISDRDMDYVMESFSVHLGVNCIFCHPSTQNGYNFSIDYVTDKLENKRIARDMLRMTMQLNKKYFNIKLNRAMTTRGRIWCKTCHQGTPVPILPAPKTKLKPATP